jgi:acid stress-induced BolA-like protein IbaG/YrbA
MLPTPEQVKDYIAGGLACQHVEVEGDGQHFFATIVSDAFEGKRLIARHQLVYAALGDRMRAEIHALSMKTLTPAEWTPSGKPA